MEAKAEARYIRVSPQKARLVVDLIRGQKAGAALNTLRATNKRIAPAVELAERGELDYLVFECLAERTTARENLTRMKDPEKGYTPRLLDRMGAVLPVCLRNDVRIVSNMGAANPAAAAREIRRYAEAHACGEVSCTVVHGDDVADIVRRQPQLRIMESGEPVETLLPRWLPPMPTWEPT